MRLLRIKGIGDGDNVGDSTGLVDDGPSLDGRCFMDDFANLGSSTCVSPSSSNCSIASSVTSSVDDGDNVDFELVTVKKRVRYAILSHTWDSDPGNEFLFEDAQNGTGQSKPGYQKVKRFLAAAKRNKSLEYGWVDTCCIDKSSSAELSEAINSMFRWYMDAELCIVHLADFPGEFSKLPMTGLRVQLSRCRWFHRGWTLQELLAPRELVFYSKDWHFIGKREKLQEIITAITGIHARALKGDITTLRGFSIAQRMSWASCRKTTRPEDIAYCLLGIFDVNMPLLYGEGHKAFLRLQEEIIKDSDDQTIFCWERGEDDSDGDASGVSFLADSPNDFQKSSRYIPIRTGKVHTYQLTNAGLRITGRLQERGGTCRLFLRCSDEAKESSHLFLKLVIKRLGPGSNQFLRVLGDLRCDFDDNLPEQEIYLCKHKPQLYPPRFMGYRVSIELLILPTPSSDLQVEEVYPPSRWDSERRTFSPIDLDPESDSLTDFSWHVVVKFSVKLAGLDTTCIACVGYNGRLDITWCKLSELRKGCRQPDLSELWSTHGYERRKHYQEFTVVMEHISAVELRCRMEKGDSEISQSDTSRWRMVLGIVR